ncbi:tyrosine-type recombinase/integrase [Lysinibacillus fusiformis]|uniref:tyrosine-type recombinase/integrase n=1 Tax=Lysinibacillus fusiformis TaxID=28031 RepID=UPI00196774FF|nr:tyrosine-type recombinase/integrase [Lysinibacillus fusiformis]QSB12304.1 tyrosine-type recombinase/integrase [Lysinibacillus fusiformis]
MEFKINIVERFTEWLTHEGKASATIASYINDVKQFNQYLAVKDVDPEVLLTRFLFTNYMKQLETEGMAVSTINKKVNSLKVYNDWLYHEKMVEDVFISIKKDKVKIATGSEAEVSVLTDTQVEQFLFHLEKESQRNKLIGYLLLYTGLRVSELVNIQLTDVDQLTAQLTVRGKGGKLREVPLRKDVLEALQQYQKGERASSKHSQSLYLLVSQRAERMHRDAARRWLEQTGVKLGFHMHPHMIRHTFATRLLHRGNVSITTVSKLCGHASLNMTMRFYINTSKEEKQSAVDKL